MTKIKSGVYKKDQEIQLKNIAKLSKSINYLAKNLMLFIRREKKSKGVKGFGGLLPSVLALDKLAMTYLRLTDKLNRIAPDSKEEEPDLALELSKDDNC